MLFLGGLIEFLTPEGTVQRWVLTSHIVAKLRSEMEEDVEMKKVLTKPKELQRSRMKLDEEAVSRCYEVLKQWQPISDSCDTLVSLSSGTKAFQPIVNSEVLKFLKNHLGSHSWLSNLKVLISFSLSSAHVLRISCKHKVKYHPASNILIQF